MPTPWIDRYGHRVENMRPPQQAAQRRAYVQTVGADGLALLAAVDADDAPRWPAGVEAVQVLREPWAQQFDDADGSWRWREASELPPSTERIASSYDVQCRYAIKRLTSWTGYKSHLSEYCGTDRPHLITDVETTDAACSDQGMVARIMTD
jgi:hypothetical protein